MKKHKPKQTGKGERFESKLELQGIKPAELARKLDVTPQLVNGWKIRGVSAKEAYRVADILKCDPHEIASLVEIRPADRIADQKARYDVVPDLPELVELFHALDAKRRASLLQIARDQAQAAKNEKEKAKGGRRETLPAIQ